MKRALATALALAFLTWGALAWIERRPASDFGAPSARVSNVEADDARASDDEVRGASGNAPVIATRIAPPADAPQLTTASVLEGRCVDESGNALAGVRIGLIPAWRGWARAVVREASSDASGQFTFTNLERFQEYFLCAVSPGRPCEGTSATPGDEPVLVIAEGHTIEGTVLDERTGGRLAGASVFGSGARLPMSPDLRAWALGLRSPASTSTGADGGFRLTGLDGGTQTLTVDAEGYVLTGFRRKIIAEKERFDLRVPRGSVTTFQVVDWESGAPIPGAEVARRLSLDPDTLRVADPSGTFDWTTRSDGKASGWFAVRAPGYCETEFAPEHALRASADRRIALVRGAILNGTVTDPSGSPVAGAVLSLRGGCPAGPIPGAPPGQRSAPPRSRTTTSDETGTFVFDGLPACDAPYTLIAAAGDDRTEAPIPIHATQAGETIVQDLRLAEGATIEGRVTLGGVPIAARVMLVDSSNRRRFVSTDEGGVYRVSGLEPGVWRACAARNNADLDLRAARAAPPLEVTIDTPLRHDFELAPGGVTVLAGRVLRENGQPVAGEQVRAIPTDARGRCDSPVTDDQGRFRLTVPVTPTSRWSLHCGSGEVKTSRYGVRAPDEALVLELPNVGRIGVRAFAAEDGLPLPRPRIKWRSDPSKRWSLLPEIALAESDVIWFDLPVGSVDLLVYQDDGLRISTEVLDVAVRSGEPTALDVQVPRGIELTITFRAADGVVRFAASGLAGLVPEIPDADRPVCTYVSPGRSRYSPLRPGVYRVTGHDAFEFAPATLTLTDAQAQSFEITWRIADSTAYERLLENLRDFEEARAAGRIGPGDY